MASITLRSVKGSPLTNAEVDANFSNLNTEVGTKVDQAGARSAVSATGSISYNSTTGVFSYTTPNSDGITEGSTNLYFSNARARGAISVTQNLTYNSTTGVITGPDLSGYLTSATAASTYQTQSGMSSYLTTASAASTYLALAGGTLTGDLSFSGNSRRITGDFSSNATIGNRLMFQSSTANGVTLVSAIPNGTGTTARWLAYNSSDPANSSAAVLSALSTDIRLSSTNNGTGTLLPLTFYVGTSTEAARISTASNFLIGTATDNATDKLQVTGSTYISGNVSIGAQTFGQKLYVEATGTGDTRVVAIGQSGSGITLTLGYYATAGTPTAGVVRAQNGLALAFEVMNAEAMRLAPTTSNLLIGTASDNATNKVQVVGSARLQAAATQDAIILAGRAGGTSSYAVTLTPTTLTASRTLTLPDNSGTVLTTGAAVTVAQGGTGIASGTSGGIPYFSGTTTIASSAALAANAIVIGGGAGAAPATTTTGTGVLTAVGNAVNATGGLVTTDGAATLTNKRVDPRNSSTASASSLTPDISAFDFYAYTALAANLTINVPTGTPADGDKLMFRFLDNGTTRTITFKGGAGGFQPVGVTLTTSGSDFTFATTVSKISYFGCVYNANASRWDVIASGTQS